MNSFKYSKNIQHEVIYHDNASFYSRVYDILIKDSMICALDMDQEYYLSMTDLRKNKIIKKFGRKGQGPGELLHIPTSISILSDNKLFFFDANTDFIYCVDYLNDPGYTPVRQLKMADKNRVMQVLPLDYNTYIALGMFEKGRYLLLNEQGEDISFFYDYPTFENDESFTNYHKAMAFQGSFISRPDGKRFFFAANSSEVLEILEIVSKSEITKIFEYHGKTAGFVPEGDGVKMVSTAIKRESQMAFVNAACTQEYIYLLYSGRIIQDNIHKAFQGNTVFVFDWNGKPIKKYNLDIDTNCITVSEDDRVLYAIAELEDDTHLIKFKL